MKLLLTNDDGIQSPALLALAKELEKDHELVIAAPDAQKSATGHSITIENPIIIRPVSLQGVSSKAYSIGGTPADCVRVAIDKLTSDSFDMVISGINLGTNLGTDVLYSGTVSAAIEAAIYKIPSIAISSEVRKDKLCYDIAAKFAPKILDTAIKNGIYKDLVLNVNVPCVEEKDIKGIQVCPIGDKTYDNYYLESTTEDNEIAVLLRGTLNGNIGSGTDKFYFNNGYVTITPLHYDLTNFKILHEVDNWFK